MKMIAWIVVPIIFLIATAVYLFFKIRGAVAYFASESDKKKRRILTIILALLIIGPAVQIFGIWFIILLHFVVFLLLTDLIVKIIKKIRKDKGLSKFWTGIYKSGLIAALLTAIVVGYGRYHLFDIVRTEYTVNTEKNISGYRLVLLSDLHYGISMNDEQLQKVADRISNENPDIVVLAGDIVDENTTLEQMNSAFKILGSIESKYGIYYTYGNHDKNTYVTVPNYSVEKLASRIEGNNIKILEDSTDVINNELVLIGRADISDRNGNRADIEDLTESLSPENEWLVIDHQPSDYDNVEKAGVDLILSGHTHAGQIWPAGLFATTFNFYDLNYGKLQKGNLTAIVTSGIAGRGYPIRTEKSSEYVVIDIKPEK